jgi:peptidoglycan/LPS O-acetylase OafA/YrhL
MPGIDGLRALAVAAVFAYHAGFGWARGGFLGVDLFFVVSGFLITSLLLAEWRQSGSLRTVRFWGRRALRLVPALIVVLVAVSIAVPLLAPDQGYRLRGDLLAGLGYVSNWRLIFEHQSYFQEIGRPPVLQHLWSLAVEEQFYLLWPLVLFGLLTLLRRARIDSRRLIWPALALAAMSAGLMAVLFDPDVDPSRVYFGTDTRAAALLVGAALACIPRRWDESRLGGRRRRVALEAVGVAAVVGLAMCVGRVDQFDTRLYRGGFLGVALLAAVAVAVASHPASWVGQALGCRPMVWLGRRSYAIYLWFWPVMTLTRPNRDVALGGVPLLVLQAGLTVALAAASYRFVEGPIRGGALGRVWRDVREWAGRREGGLRPVTTRWVAGIGVATVAVATSLVVDHPVQAPEFAAAASSAPVAPAAATATTSTAIVETTTTGAPVVETTVAAATAPVEPAPVTAPPPATPTGQVTAIGESVLLEAQPTLEAEVPGINVVGKIGRQAPASLAIAKELRDGGQLGEVVVVHIGNNGIMRADTLDELMQALAGVRRVAVVNLKVPRPWEEPNNAVIAETVPRYPNAVLLDWKALGEANPGVFYSDGVHLRPEGIRLYTDLVRSGL